MWKFGKSELCKEKYHRCADCLQYGFAYKLTSDLYYEANPALVRCRRCKYEYGTHFYTTKSLVVRERSGGARAICVMCNKKWY